MSTQKNSRLQWRRALLATTAALAFGQNAAWATCLDGSTFPPGGDGRLRLRPGQLDQRSDHRRTHRRRAQLGLGPGLYTLQAG
jgi:hypothetical protein